MKHHPILGTIFPDATTFVRIDLDRLVETRLLIQANSGAGKSWTIRRLLEQTHGSVQQIVVDREDEFSTLRAKYDYILAGKEGGDCPADVRSAALLARRLLELRVSAVVGISELKAHERPRFVKLFLESLINAPRDLWHPCLVVIDEAHIFCPQSGDAESGPAVRDLMKIFPADKQVDTYWLGVMDDAAAGNKLNILKRQVGGEQLVGDVYELAIDCKDWEGTLDALVHFLYSLESTGVMLDMRQMFIRPNPADHAHLKGSFVLYCAYMRERPAAAAHAAEGGARKPDAGGRKEAGVRKPEAGSRKPAALPSAPPSKNP